MQNKNIHVHFNVGSTNHPHDHAGAARSTVVMDANAKDVMVHGSRSNDCVWIIATISSVTITVMGLGLLLLVVVLLAVALLVVCVCCRPCFSFRGDCAIDTLQYLERLPDNPTNEFLLIQLQRGKTSNSAGRRLASDSNATSDVPTLRVLCSIKAAARECLNGYRMW